MEVHVVTLFSAYKRLTTIDKLSSLSTLSCNLVTQSALFLLAGVSLRPERWKIYGSREVKPLAVKGMVCIIFSMA